MTITLDDLGFLSSDAGERVLTRLADEDLRDENTLKLIDISNNLGDTKSLITHPATTTHQRLTPEARAGLGVTESMLRISVGLEDPADLCEDLEQALAKA